MYLFQKFNLVRNPNACVIIYYLTKVPVFIIYNKPIFLKLFSINEFVRDLIELKNQKI